MYKRYQQLLDENGIVSNTVAKATGIAATTFSAWKTGKSTPKQDKMQKIADYFGVSLEWLTGTSNYRTKAEWLEALDSPENLYRVNDEIDIAEQIERTLNTLEHSQDALAFNGEPLDDETRELLKTSLENSYRVAKTILDNKK